MVTHLEQIIFLVQKLLVQQGETRCREEQVSHNSIFKHNVCSIQTALILTFLVQSTVFQQLLAKATEQLPRVLSGSISPVTARLHHQLKLLVADASILEHFQVYILFQMNQAMEYYNSWSPYDSLTLSVSTSEMISHITCSEGASPSCRASLSSSISM